MDRLAGPNLKLTRAQRHIGELIALLRDFFAHDPYEVIKEHDPETGWNLARVKINAEPDPIWSAMIGDAVHNLRAALDLVYWQLVEVNGKTPNTDDAFRISDSETAFNNGAVPKIRRRAGAKALEIIRDTVKPYKGGNNALWALHKLDIIDKHRLLLVVASANPHIVISIQGSEGAPVQSLYKTNTSWPLKDGDELPGYRQIAVAGTEVVAAGPEMQPKFEYAFDVTLYEPEVIPTPDPLEPTLLNMGVAVVQAIEALTPLLV